MMLYLYVCYAEIQGHLRFLANLVSGLPYYSCLSRHELALHYSLIGIP